MTRADFDRVRSAYPAHISNRDVVHALVRAEVLAQKAQKDGLWARWLIRPYKRALVRRLLRIEFEEKYTAKQVKAADIDRAWRRSPIRVRYSHAKGWWVTDAQLLCCQGDWRRCKIDPTAQACITKLQPMAYELYGKLTANPPKTPEHMCGRVRNMTGEFPSVTCNDISYFYDDSKPYDQQGDYDLMLESYVLGVAKIKPGTIGEPIRTPHGWHIVRLDRIEPALDGKLTDPKVRADIAQGILTGVRIRDVQIRAIDLLRANNVAIFYDNLSKRLIGGGKKKVDKPTSSPK
ncbi:MAG: peptidyl-prolyl cis-trans isomerase [Myxococcales bacterium]|nr:peptidyl-prolyl cis-trans isomerase [Myxococcales bacterium]